MARRKSNLPEITISKPLTIEDLTAAKDRMMQVDHSQEVVIMSTNNYKDLQKFFNSIIELELGDWVFINDNGHLYIGEVTEVDIEDITTEYKVHVKESTEAKKSIFLLLTGREDIIKVAKGSKLKTLRLLHGR